ncbi:MAG TPA: dockerin type I domain-containing protein [Fimbriimonadaceae bacterium]|nr:dockerin type I domain-containing protein [Fimbriimonadaceae bacterium]
MLSGAGSSSAYAVSGDGSTVVGSCSLLSTGATEAFYWNQAGGMQGLGMLTGGMQSTACAASMDGSAVVGISESAQGDRAFLWTQSSGMVSLGTLGGSGGSQANGVSADGSVVVGSSGGTAFRWTQPKLAFCSFRDGFYQIYSMNEDGSDQTRLTNNTYDDEHPSWSPNRQQIAFARRIPGGGTYQIYAMGADGTGQSNLTNDQWPDENPAWSPDGSKIAFDTIGRGADVQAIYVINPNGSGLTELSVPGAAYDSEPAWSPDGTRIAFTSFRDGNFEIYVMNSDGSGQIRLTNSPGTDSYPRWSPDGSKIVFMSDRTGTTQIWEMNANGTGQTNLSANSVSDEYPDFSPDGGRIVFDRTVDGGITYQVWTMSAGGGGEVMLSSSGDQQPRWSSAMVGIAPGEAYGVSADGSVVVGYLSGSGTPFRWTQAGGVQDLGGGAGGRACGVSPDGSVVVGEDGSGHAFVWTASLGMLNLRDVLVAEGCGSQVSAWTLDTAYSVTTAPGGAATIVGVGRPSGGTQGFIATINSVQIVSGHIDLQDYVASAVAGTQVTVEIRNAGSTTPIDSQVVTLDASGNFSFNAHVIIPPADYDISAKGSHWLRRTLTNLPLGITGFAGLSFSLINGDINGDNHVTLGDFGKLKLAYGSVPGAPSWNPNADLNGNGSVGLSDFGILKKNFGQDGDQ